MKSGILSKKSHISHSRSPQRSGILGASLFGALVGFIFSVALLIAFSFVCLASKNPDSLISPLALIASSISFFAAGLAASKKRSAPLPCGALTGAFMCAVFWVVSRILGTNTDSGNSFAAALILRLVLIFICIVGALIGANSGRRRRIT